MAVGLVFNMIYFFEFRSRFAVFCREVMRVMRGFEQIILLIHPRPVSAFPELFFHGELIPQRHFSSSRNVRKFGQSRIRVTEMVFEDLFRKLPCSAKTQSLVVGAWVQTPLLVGERSVCAPEPCQPIVG